MTKDPIKRVEVAYDCLLVLTQYKLLVFEIKIGAKTYDLEGHTDSVLNLITIEPKDLHLQLGEKSNKIEEFPKVLSCSLDNTIRFWDSKDMKTISVLENDERSELACIAYLPNCGLVASGHEDGHIRLWNIEIGTHILMTTKESKGKHDNTVSCLKAIKYKNSEWLIAGSYNGWLSLWEIGMRTSSTEMVNTTVSPKL